MTNDQARNIAQLLREDPLYYRTFGIFWYHVKSELNRLGYADAAGLTTPYTHDDPVAHDHMEGMTAPEMTASALALSSARAFAFRYDPGHVLPDGESYDLYDPDTERPQVR